MWCTLVAEERSWTGRSPPLAATNMEDKQNITRKYRICQKCKEWTALWPFMVDVFLWRRNLQYLVTGEELFKCGSWRQVRQRRDDSEDETFHIRSHKWALVLYRTEPAGQKQIMDQWSDSLLILCSSHLINTFPCSPSIKQVDGRVLVEVVLPPASPLTPPAVNGHKLHLWSCERRGWTTCGLYTRGKPPVWST